MKTTKWAVLALTLSTAIPTPVFAHRTWVLPSSTVLSGDDPWVTVDAAAGNELFYFDHRPLRLDDLVVLSPKGEQVEVQNASEGRFRSTFDVQLTDEGTYRISMGGSGLFGGYKLNGEQHRWRGSADELASAIPQGATDINISESHRRIDTFVTVKAPTTETVEPTGNGLELAYDTHPNDLFSGETASFRILMNGEPAPGVEVSIVPGGNRYRNALEEIKISSDTEGAFSVTWPEAGMYWLNASFEDDQPSVAEATRRRAGYTVTLEVLPQ